MAGGQGFSASAGSVGRAITLALIGAVVSASAGSVSPNNDGIVPLTGSAVSAQQETISPSWGQNLSGSESTSANGAAGVSVRPTDPVGQAITSGAGTVSAAGDSVTVNISGVEAEFASGAVSGGTQAVSGQAVATQQTAPAVDLVLPISGLSCSCDAGVLASSQEADDTLLTASAGSAAASVSVAVSGAESTSALGTLTVTGDSFSALTGEALTTSAGSVEANKQFALTGAEIVLAQQNVGAPGGASLSGAEIVSAAGDVFTTNDRTFAITGQEFTSLAGTTFASPLAFAIGEESIVIAQEIGPRELALIGQEAATEIGSVDILAPEVGSGPFYKRFKRKYAVWIGGVRYLGTQEDFEKLVEEHITDGDMLAPVISVEANRKFQDEARELERQLNQLAKQVKRRYKLTDKEILDFL